MFSWTFPYEFETYLIQTNENCEQLRLRYMNELERFPFLLPDEQRIVRQEMILELDEAMFHQCDVSSWPLLPM